jgi:hypothetical protein
MKTLLKIQFMLICLLLVACSSQDEPAPVEELPEEEPGPDVVAGDSKDFFPMTENKQWEYLHAVFTTGEDSVLISTETKSLRIDGDTVVENHTYKRFVDENGFLRKVARKEGMQYFGRNHELYGGFTHEYMFLDTDVAEGGTWSYLKNEGATKTEYVVKKNYDEYKLRNLTFKNVKEVEVNYYELQGESYVFLFSATHVYAAGLGEIYAYYPDPASSTRLNISITGYQTN